MGNIRGSACENPVETFPQSIPPDLADLRSPVGGSGSGIPALGDWPGDGKLFQQGGRAAGREKVTPRGSL